MRLRNARPAGLLALMWVALHVAAVPAVAQSPDPAAVRAHATELRTLAQRIEDGTVPAAEARSRALAAVTDTQVFLTAEGFPPAAVEAHLHAARERLAADSDAGPVHTVVDDVAARLDALAAVPAWRPAPDPDHVDGATVRRALEAELAKGAYTQQDVSRPAKYMGAIWSYIKQKLDDFFSGGWGARVANASDIFMRVLLLLAFGALLWLLATSYRRRAGPARASASAIVDTRRMADASVYRLRAQDHAAAGRYRDAVRALFLMVLAELEERNLVVLDRTRTNAEYLRYLRRRAGAGPLVEEFGRVTQTFNRTWYGHAPCDAAGYDAFAERVGLVVREADTAA